MKTAFCYIERNKSPSPIGRGVRGEGAPSQRNRRNLPHAPSPLPLSRGERGFTLLEIVVAFAIAALSFTALSQIFSNALSATERADGTTQATLIAQSKLAQVGTVIPLDDGGQAGQEQGGLFRWEITISPYEPPKVENPQAPVALTNLTFPLEMKKIEATVRFGEPERVLTLQTYRTVAKKQ